MILKNLTKASINKALKGFTLIELLIGAMIASIASIAIIYAVIYVQTRTYELEEKKELSKTKITVLAKQEERLKTSLQEQEKKIQDMLKNQASGNSSPQTDS